MNEVRITNIVVVSKFAYWAGKEDYFGKKFNAGKYKKALY